MLYQNKSMFIQQILMCMVNFRTFWLFFNYKKQAWFLKYFFYFDSLIHNKWDLPIPKHSATSYMLMLYFNNITQHYNNHNFHLKFLIRFISQIKIEFVSHKIFNKINIIVIELYANCSRIIKITIYKMHVDTREAAA